jgi:hypothetical protein
MVKSLAGIAAAAILAAVSVPTAPANAAAIHHAPGLAEHQGNTEAVQYRYYHRYGPRWRGYRGYYGPRYYGGGPYYGYGYPYAYGPYPYRRYWGPRPFVGFGVGPFGFGVW